MTRTLAFQAFPQTLLELMRPGQGIYVPVYQRSYTWGADQIDRLFEDVNAGLKRSVATDGPPTFLGSLILFEGRASVSPRVNTALPAQVLHVVDGQQRLTTLLLILGQLRTLLDQAIKRIERSGTSTEVCDWVSANLRTLQSQLSDALWVELPSASGAYSWLPRLIRQATDVWGDGETSAKYQSDIAVYLHGIACEEMEGLVAVPAASRPHLKLAIDSINEHLSQVSVGSDEGSTLLGTDFVTDLSTLNHLLPLVPAEVALDQSSITSEGWEAIYLAVFAQFLLSKVILIDVRAPNEETAFTLFEPLNTTGQPLTPIETLMPLVVRSEGGLDSYIGSRCDVAFKGVARYVPDELDSTERSKRVSALLTSFALGQDGTKLAHNMLEQRRYLRSAFDAAPDLSAKRVFVEGVADTAAFLSDVWEDAESALITMGMPEDRLSLEVLRASNHVIVVPLLVRYFERAEQLDSVSSRADFRAVVRAVAAFWTIWRASRTTTSGIDNVHRSLIRSGLDATSLKPFARSVTSVEDLPSVGELRSALRHILADKLSVTDGASWASRVGSQQIYETARILARYILVCAHDDAVPDPSAVGHAIRGASGTWPTRSLEVWRSHYSVEHIAPQRKKSADDSYSDVLYHEGDINRLGNLTLLPADMNGLIGNQSWGFKRDVFKMVSMTDQTERLAALRQGNLNRLGARSKALIASSDFIPFCKFVAEYSGPTIDRGYVLERGKRLAALAWERLWADLT